MADFEPRLISVRALGGTVLILSVVLVLVCVVGTFQEGSDSVFWPIALVISLVCVILTTASYVLMKILGAVESNTYKQAELLNRLFKHLDRVNQQLSKLNENILLSEDAKAIAFREKDFNALRQAIDEEIEKQNWESAEYLIRQMEQKFGYRTQAQQLRNKIEQIKQEQFAQAIAEEKEKFEKYLAEYDWTGAANEIALIKQKFPAAENEIRQLEERLEAAKTARKKQLLNLWDQAVKKNEIDRGIEILKELDRYLTPNEVAALEESARGVFRAKLHNLGMQFSLLVTEKIWDKAYEVANEIINEFPNSRMAQEIRERIDALREKARAMKTESQEREDSAQ